MIQTTLDGCPNRCDALELDYNVETIDHGGPYGETAIIIQAYCAHCNVCKIREGEPDWTIRDIA